MVHMELRIYLWSISSLFFWEKKEKSSSLEQPLFSIAVSRSLKNNALFRAGNCLSDFGNRIDVCRDTRNTVLDKPHGHFRGGAGLSADRTLDIIFPAYLDRVVDQVKYRRVLGLVHVGNILIVTVDCKRVLDEIIGPEGCKLYTAPDEIFDHDRA